MVEGCKMVVVRVLLEVSGRGSAAVELICLSAGTTCELGPTEDFGTSKAKLGLLCR